MTNHFCFLPFNSLMTNGMVNNSVKTHTDIRSHGWWRWLPPISHPYIYISRLDRPIGWWLLLLPGWWAIALGAPGFISIIWFMLLFLIGAIVTRAAGCIINDMWDRNLDQMVARTSARPLAAGTMSMQQASLFLIALGLTGLLVLVQLPILAVYVGLAATPLVILYPLAKRVTWFPQFVLGLTFSWGVFLGWTAVTNSLPDLSLILIYAGCAAWVFGYDTIYAVQDIDDDKKVGVKSSALALASNIKAGVGTAYCLAVLLIAAGLLLHDPQPVFTGWLGLAAMALHLGNQIRMVRIDDAVLALALFKSNRNAGLWLVAGLMLDRLFVS